MALADRIENFRAKILFSFVAVFIISWAAVLAATYLNMSKDRIKEHEELRKQFHQIYDHELELYKEIYSTNLGILTHSARMPEHFSTNWKEHFLENFESDFNYLKEAAFVSHISFSTAEGDNIAYFHSSHDAHAFLARNAQLKATKGAETVSGVEMSLSGTLVHWTIKPVIGENGPRGYIEIGRELDGLWGEIAKQLDLSIILVASKDLVTPNNWENRKARHPSLPDWSFFKHHVGIGSFGHSTETQDVTKTVIETQNLNGEKTVRLKGQTYHHDAIPLYDFSGAEIAKAILIHPEPLLSEAIVKNLGGAAGTSAFTLSIGLLLCYLILNPVTRSIQDRQEELEREVQRRTKDLRAANKAALQAKEEALKAQQETEAASKAKSEFLSNMSHELRTPLNAIIGFSSIIKNDELDEGISPRYKSYVKDINHSGAHLLSLINDILDLTRIEAGKLELRFQPISTRQLLDECHQMMNLKATKKGVPIIHKDYVTSIDMDADPTRLKQIILNLLSNALKFTKPPGTIQFYAHQISDTEVEFVVEDEGIGVAEENHELILQRFGQVKANAEIKDKEDGMGIGLNLVNDLVEKHNGTFTFESWPGKGTRASFILPLHQEDAHSFDVI